MEQFSCFVGKRNEEVQSNVSSSTLTLFKGHAQVIVSEPHVLHWSQPIICGSRFLSDAKISPGDQRISTENV